MLLAIDTATRAASIALYRAEGILAELTWRTFNNHTVETMAQIARLLEMSRAAKTDLQAIGVARGPGSFTGLRVGMSIAKGLAYGHNIPLIAIPTMDALAHAHASNALPIWAILEAGRGRFTVARYAAARGAVERASDYALVNADGLLDLIAPEKWDDATLRAPRALICGDVDAALVRMIAERYGARVVIASPAANARRAGFLAELAWARFQRGESDATASVAPMYTPYLKSEIL